MPGVPHPLVYPENLTAGNLAYFLAAPTLVRLKLSRSCRSVLPKQPHSRQPGLFLAGADAGEADTLFCFIFFHRNNRTAGNLAHLLAAPMLV